MSQNTNMQERYSKIVDAKLRANSVFAAIFNQKHDGTPAAGAVKIPTRAEATVAAYDIASGGSLTSPSTTYVTMVCDNDYYVNELIDGYMAAAVPDGMVAERLDSAGYALANQIDALLAAYLESAGTASSDSTTLTASNVYGLIIDDIAAAKTLKVDPNKIWVAVDPATYALLLQSDQFVQATANVAELGAGYLGKIGGVPVYESLNLGCSYVVGNSDFCHFAEEWTVPVGVYDLADGAHIGCSAVQGRKAFGFTITQPTTVIYHA